MNAFLQRLLLLARRNSLATIACVLFLAFGVADYFFWRWNRLREVEHQRTRTQGENLLQALAGHGRIQSQLSTAQDALGFIDKNLVVEPDLAGNLDYFYQMEKTARVRLNNLNQLSSQPALADSPYKTVPFSMQIVGSYRQTMHFIHEIETGPRVAKIKAYSLARSESAADTVTLNLTVEMLARP